VGNPSWVGQLGWPVGTSTRDSHVGLSLGTATRDGRSPAGRPPGPGRGAGPMPARSGGVVCMAGASATPRMGAGCTAPHRHWHGTAGTARHGRHGAKLKCGRANKRQEGAELKPELLRRPLTACSGGGTRRVDFPRISMSGNARMGMMILVKLARVVVESSLLGPRRWQRTPSWQRSVGVGGAGIG
jgi:hypothetical protein